MKLDRKVISANSIQKALRVRNELQIPINNPCNAFDIAERLGIEVRFVSFPSIEGIYYKEKKTIIISSLRPQGRQMFTCAHEIGHHVNGHGEQVDELIEDRTLIRKRDIKELEADCFAAELLMPKMTVLNGMRMRNIDPSKISAFQVYILANWLGVGYTSLIKNLEVQKIINKKNLDELKKIRLSKIREEILGFDCKEHLVVVDDAWIGSAVDVQVGDFILLPPDASIEGNVISETIKNKKNILVRAEKQGLGKLILKSNSIEYFIRVSRKNFAGLASFRHLEEVNDEE